MKILKLLLLNCFFVLFAFVNVFGVPKKTLDKQTQEKIKKDSGGFFEMLKNKQQISFDAQTQKQIVDLYLFCKVNDVRAINAFIVVLKKHVAQEVVTATLLFAIKLNDAAVGRNILGKQKLCKFIFDAFKSKNKTVSALLIYAIDLGIDVDAFGVLKKLFEKIFLANDKLQEEFSEFFRKKDCYSNMQFLYASAAESKAKKLLKTLDQVAKKFGLYFELSDGLVENDKEVKIQDEDKEEAAAEKNYQQYYDYCYGNEDSLDPDEEIFRY